MWSVRVSLYVPSKLHVETWPLMLQMGLVGDVRVMEADPSWTALCCPPGDEWVLILSVHGSWLFKRAQNPLPSLLLPLLPCDMPAPPPPLTISKSFLRPHQRLRRCRCHVCSVCRTVSQMKVFPYELPCLRHSFTVMRNRLTHAPRLVNLQA